MWLNVERLGRRAPNSWRKDRGGQWCGRRRTGEGAGEFSEFLSWGVDFLSKMKVGLVVENNRGDLGRAGLRWIVKINRRLLWGLRGADKQAWAWAELEGAWRDVNWVRVAACVLWMAEGAQGRQPSQTCFTGWTDQGALQQHLGYPLPGHSQTADGRCERAKVQPRRLPPAGKGAGWEGLALKKAPERCVGGRRFWSCQEVRKCPSVSEVVPCSPSFWQREINLTGQPAPCCPLLDSAQLSGLSCSNTAHGEGQQPQARNLFILKKSLLDKYFVLVLSLSWKEYYYFEIKGSIWTNSVRTTVKFVLLV